MIAATLFWASIIAADASTADLLTDDQVAQLVTFLDESKAPSSPDPSERKAIKRKILRKIKTDWKIELTDDQYVDVLKRMKASKREKDNPPVIETTRTKDDFNKLVTRSIKYRSTKDAEESLSIIVVIDEGAILTTSVTVFAKGTVKASRFSGKEIDFYRDDKPILRQPISARKGSYIGKGATFDYRSCDIAFDDLYSLMSESGIVRCVAAGLPITIDDASRSKIAQWLDEVQDDQGQ